MRIQIEKLSNEEVLAFSERLQKLSNQELLSLYEDHLKEIERCEEQMSAALRMRNIVFGGYPERHKQLFNELPIIKAEVAKRMH